MNLNSGVLSRKKIFVVSFALIVVLSAFLRVYQIDLRPFHNDEGVNHFFIEQMKGLGYYKYSHENYHGPAYFYLTRLCTFLLGEGEFGMRCSAVLMGLLLILLLAALARTEGSLLVILAALFTGLSSSLVFYSRYAIHESLFLFATALCGFSCYLWWKTAKPFYFYSGALGVGLLITTKETFIISLFCIFFATLSLGNYRKTLGNLWNQRRHLCLALILMTLLIIVVFSGGFQWYGGLREMFLAVPQWIGRNESDTGHFKPFLYYTHIIIGPELTAAVNEWFDSSRYYIERLFGLGVAGWIKDKLSYNGYVVDIGTEVYLALALILPCLFMIVHPRRSISFLVSAEGAFFRFISVWAILAFTVYSCVSYKTPWLIINLTFPLILVLTWCLERICCYDWGWDSQESKPPPLPDGMVVWFPKQLIGAVIIVFLAGSAAQLTYWFNFKLPYGSQDSFNIRPAGAKKNIRNPFSYVHSHPGMLELVADIDKFRVDHPDARVLVGVKQYWPLPYYLRNFKNRLGYLVTEDPEKLKNQYQILILDSKVGWAHPDWAKKYYRISDVQETHTYFKRK
jgi:uncharacterized protein (TIGR03663 family)